MPKDWHRNDDLSIFDELADQETKLLSILECAAGLLDKKAEQLEHLGVYAQYREIYSRYQALLAGPAHSLEALKRVVFLCWYSMAEPCVLTGLRDIPADMPSFYPLLEQDRAAAARLIRETDPRALITCFAFGKTTDDSHVVFPDDPIFPSKDTATAEDLRLLFCPF